MAGLDVDVEGLGGGERRDGAEVVVDDLEGGAGADVAAEEDALRRAHVLQVRRDGREDAVRDAGAASDHEGQRAGLGAHGAAGDGGVDKGEGVVEFGFTGFAGGAGDADDGVVLDGAALHYQLGLLW